MKIKCIAACFDTNGTPTFIGVNIECEDHQYDIGEHYDTAKYYAQQLGYEKPVIVYDENDGPDWFFANFEKCCAETNEGEIETIDIREESNDS